MGYDLHITRKDHWSDEDSSKDIAFSEWLAFVHSDPEMRVDGHAETTLPDGRTLRVTSKGLSVWRAHSRYQEDRIMPFFHYFEGCIDVKNPDAETRRKMHQIAHILRAKVQGDDGELYGPDGRQIKE